MRTAYARLMLFLVLAVIVLAVLAFVFRVPLLARILGQSESRVDRRINRRR